MNWLESVWQQAHSSPATAISLTSLGVSGFLFALKIWEMFFKDRMKLATSYMLSGERGGRHEIVIANLSPLPVQVAHWELAWEPRWCAFWLKKIDVTAEGASRFKISGRDDEMLVFDGEDHFVWNGKVASGRELVLRLKLFGQKRKVTLVIGAGQEPDWWRNIRKRLPRLPRKSVDDL